jgi:hypothetical protein
MPNKENKVQIYPRSVRRRVMSRIATITKRDCIAGELRLPEAIEESGDDAQFIAAVATAIRAHHGHSALLVNAPPPRQRCQPFLMILGGSRRPTFSGTPVNVWAASNYTDT